MAIDFNKIDQAIDWKGFNRDVKEAKKNGGGDFPTIPAGKYEARLDNLEIKNPKGKPNDLMLEIRFKIISGQYKGQKIWQYIKFLGSKNDSSAVSRIETFLDSLDSGVSIVCTPFSVMNDTIMEICEAVDGKLEYAIEYDPDAFNRIHIDEVFEVED